MFVKKNRKSGTKSPLPQFTKKQLKLLFIGMFILIIIGIIATYLMTNNFELKEDTVQNALNNTFDAQTYSFTTQSTIYLDGASRLFCDLQGRVSGANHHISGEVLGSAVNIYFVDNSIYQQSALNLSWRQIDNADFADAVALLNEISPQINFNFRQIGAASYLGKEEIDGQIRQIISFEPIMANTWIDQYFRDIKITLWLDQKGEFIKQAEIAAIANENPSVSLLIKNSFDNFNQEMIITAPL